MGNHGKIRGILGEETVEIYNYKKVKENVENVTGNFITFYQKRNVNSGMAQAERKIMYGLK